jgi:hypothetical protein
VCLLASWSAKKNTLKKNYFATIITFLVPEGRGVERVSHQLDLLSPFIKVGIIDNTLPKCGHCKRIRFLLGQFIVFGFEHVLLPWEPSNKIKPLPPKKKNCA